MKNPVFQLAPKEQRDKITHEMNMLFGALSA
jgi:hypothetical protein